jgi:hypothetical protein
MAERGLLDSRLVDLLFDNYSEISPYVAEKQAAARMFYKRQFSSENGLGPRLHGDAEKKG